MISNMKNNTKSKKIYNIIYNTIISLCILINIIIVIYNVSKYDYKEFFKNDIVKDICEYEKDKLFYNESENDRYIIKEIDDIKIQKYIIAEYEKCKRKQNEVYMYIYSKYIVDSPVVKSNYDEKYLRRDLDGRYEICGTPYIQQYSICNIQTICGHNMLNGKSFGRLKNMLNDRNNNGGNCSKYIFYVYDGKNISKYIFKYVYEYIDGEEQVNILDSSIFDNNSIILKTCTTSISTNNSRRLYILKKYDDSK